MQPAESLPTFEMTSIAKLESYGGHSAFAIDIQVHGFEQPLTNPNGGRKAWDEQPPIVQQMNRAAGKAAEELLNTLHLIRVQHDPQQRELRQRTIDELTGLFPEPIYVQVIPTGYGQPGDWEYWASPWLLVTTKRGVIEIGWRNHVISIDWSKTNVAATALELFPAEDVTKSGKMIHAWSTDKALEYVYKILGIPLPVLP